MKWEWMIDIGDLVYLRFKGGFIHDRPTVSKSRLGLVMKAYREKGAVPQFFVSFDQQEPKWFYHHDIQKVEREENNG